MRKVSSNLNSKLFRFHCVVRPNLGSCYFCKRLEEKTFVNNLPHTNIEIGDKPSSFHLEDWWKTPWLLLPLQKVHLNKESILEREKKRINIKRHSSPWRLAGEKKSNSYNHKTTIWVIHEYYLNPEFQKIWSRAFWVITILGFSPYVTRVDFKGFISK